MGFFENQDVLQWQCLQRLQVCKPDSFHLSFDLLHGHLVHQFNGHIGILLAVFDKDDATAGNRAAVAADAPDLSSLLLRTNRLAEPFRLGTCAG